MSLYSYQLQKIEDETVLDKTWENVNMVLSTKQTKLCSLQLMKLRKYLTHKKLNCLTCSLLNLDFEKGYNDCFRNQNHRIELISDDPHVFCKITGLKINTSSPNRYDNHYYCCRCSAHFSKIDVFCVCCGNKLRHETLQKKRFKRKLLRN